MFATIKFFLYAAGLLLVSVIVNVTLQLLFPKKNEPPVVFHWVPFIGNAVAYGMDPYNFFSGCRKKHGDIFTFVLLGRKITAYLGVEGNEFILNGKAQDFNAEEIYGPLTTPVFGSGVIYDCPNSKLMEQKKFVKFGLTQKALESHVQLIEKEVIDYLKCAPAFKGECGTVDISNAMAEITIYTAGRALQGEEVRNKMTAELASLYHDLDMGFRPINFIMPWAPLPRNRKRDAAFIKMRSMYLGIINERRANGNKEESDMIWNLMRCTYKDGNAIPDQEIAHMMITLLMAGQHSSSSAGSWIMLHLASRPDIVQELYDEQMHSLGRDGHLPPLEYSDFDKLPLLHNVVKETLRIHSSIHSVMRMVKNPVRVPGSPYTIAPGKVALASPMMTARSEEHFPNSERWDPHRWDDHVAGDEAGDDHGIDFSKGSRSPYLPFGAGRHRCIGEKFAYVQLGVIIATMVREFRLETLSGKEEVPPTDYTSLFSRPAQPAVLRWERRYK